MVFSAPLGFTDHLIRIGEATAQGTPTSAKHVFQIYRHIAKQHGKGAPLEQALADITSYEEQTENTLRSINKRFDGNVKAKLLTLGGELASAALMKSIMNSNGIERLQHRPA